MNSKEREANVRRYGPTQAEIYAEHLLEKVMHRQHYTSKTRDEIAALFDQFGDGVKRKSSRPLPQNRVNKRVERDGLPPYLYAPAEGGAV